MRERERERERENDKLIIVIIELLTITVSLIRSGLFAAKYFSNHISSKDKHSRDYEGSNDSHDGEHYSDGI